MNLSKGFPVNASPLLITEVYTLVVFTRTPAHKIEGRIPGLSRSSNLAL